MFWDVVSFYRYGFVFFDYDWNFNESDVIEMVLSRFDVIIICLDLDSLVILEFGVLVGSIELFDVLFKFLKLNIDLYICVVVIEVY